MNTRVTKKIIKRRNAMKAVADATIAKVTNTVVEKDVKDFTIADVLKTAEYFANISKIVTELETSRKEAGKMHRLKSHPIDVLMERGVWNPGEMTVLFAGVMNKTLTGYSARERQFIESVGKEAFNFTMKTLLDNEYNNKRAKMKNDLADELCEYCPYMRGEIDKVPGTNCEGTYCDTALDNYISENETKRKDSDGNDK